MKAQFYFFSLLLLLSSCKKEEPEHGTPQTISTVLSVTPTTATIEVTGNIYSTTTMQEWGMKYAAEEPYHYQTFHENATITGNSVTFTHTLTNLSDSTTYYMVPYCYFDHNDLIRSKDTIRFTTPPEPIIPYGTIGETGPGGGLIFYVDGQGGGMEMSTVQRFGSWVDEVGVSGCVDDFGAGENNTLLITYSVSIAYSAPQKCFDLVEGGFDDWFLPSLNELDSIYVNLVQNSHFTPLSGNYLSSTQNTMYSNYCMQLNFVNGSHVMAYKPNDANYVAVRRF